MKILFILFALMLSGAASAEDYHWRIGGVTTQYQSAPAACSAAFSKNPTPSVSGGGVVYAADGASASCMGTDSGYNPPRTMRYYTATRYGNGCTAPAVYDAVLRMCKVPDAPALDPCADKNPFVRSFYYTAGVPVKPPTVFAPCMVTTKALGVCKKVTVGPSAGKLYCSWEMVRTGAKWDGNETTNPSGEYAAPDPTDTKLPVSPEIEGGSDGSCPRGTVAAGRDSRDVQICIGTGTGETSTSTPQPKVESSRTRTNADGSITVTTTTTTTNADGSTTTATVEKTTTAGGLVLTSENNQTSNALDGTPGVPSGGGSGTGSTAEPAKNICQLNPSLTICKNSSVSGSCGAVTCSGDAIQCATLRAASAMQCQQEKDIEELQASPLTTSGKAILSGADPQKAAVDAALAGSIVDVSRPNLDASGFFGSSSCFPNRSIQVLGKSIEVSFTSVCNSIHPLRFAILALSYLAAYLIIARSLMSD